MLQRMIPLLPSRIRHACCGSCAPARATVPGDTVARAAPIPNLPGRSMNDVSSPMPRPTAQIAPFYAVLGLDLTIEFILAFGGSSLNLSHDPKGRGMVEAMVGYEKAKALAALDRLPKRVPLAKRWLATVLARKGYSTASIARTLRVTEVSVSKWLKEGRLV